ncbi:UV DNA damage endonuclease [Geomicrobium sp. JCM 19037]|uniref:UV DNA damage repair endonuclease UvsE n=1 Tax=Geomicrobium sp. JCM 19037 TaxID=1460634 RepID=UPI00045F2A74|nr:UV DNA damage repair endonuclease UvsE [Geomicrobium sp. JCM 19037]GAK05614.1 UV DNA damage endonuclease [Geomicrobium sp. JCM 19037]
MHIRFGFVANALDLYEASPAKTVTFSRYRQLGEKEGKKKLHDVTEMNLLRTKRIIHYLIAHEIPLYRFSSSLVPLATHPETQWDYITPFSHLYKEIGTLVKTHQLRTSFHPNQFTLFTSDRDHVTEKAVEDLVYHYELAKAMGLHKEIRINIHVGGAYGDKQKALERFHNNIKKVPTHILKQLTLENDDKTYTTTETLAVAEQHSIPMMFDYHHYVANHTDEEELTELLPRVFATWESTSQPAKIHISSPKSKTAFRSHADYVDETFLEPLLDGLKTIRENVDFMIEAKAKDRACLSLIDCLSKKRGMNQVTGGSIVIR